MKCISKTEIETRGVAQILSKNLKAGDVICLIGDLGAGKTTFVKGMAQGLGIRQGEVNSPTFVLMNVYEAQIPLYHFDLYRLETVGEMNQLGLEEYLYGSGIAVIEWAERLGPLMPEEYLEVNLQHINEGGRSIGFVPHGTYYESLLKNICKEIGK